MTKLVMRFASDSNVTLEQTEFYHPLLDEVQRCIRGKSAGAYRGYCTFQWTPAVQGLSILVLETMAAQVGSSGTVRLQGTEGSPASSLDFSISKLPNWLQDIFGVDRLGNPLARRIFHRTNPERKRSGPVVVALNEHFIARGDIVIEVNGEMTSDPVELAYLAEIVKREFRSSRTERAKGRSSCGGQRRELHCPCCGTSFAPPHLSVKAA